MRCSTKPPPSWDFLAQQCFTSLEAALDGIDADAVLTVTPPAVHVEHAQLAFARGLHLLTEKPIAHDLPSAKRMVELADAAPAGSSSSRRTTATRRPCSGCARCSQRNTAGELGHGHIDFYIPADFTGSFRQTMQFPLLVDMAIHHLDLIRAVTGRQHHARDGADVQSRRGAGTGTTPV